MRYALIFAGLASLASASPAPQAIDFAAINAAPSPAVVGPAVTAAAQTMTYSASAIGSAAVTGAASASATASQAAKRDLEGRNVSWCFWGVGWGCPTVTTTSCTTTSAATKTSSPVAQSTSTPAKTTSSSAAATSSITSMNTAKPTPTGIPSTCTNTWTNTNTFTSSAGCPTPYEVGTYCGFQNPEDPCATQPDGYGPHVSPDTPDAFLGYSAFKVDALTAAPPAGYIESFVDLNASTSANTYLGLHTLQSYDVQGCADYCTKSTGTPCTAFNIYIERDPSLNPSTEYCCPNPASITNYKCTLWGSTIDSTTATNAGQYREQFDVVITGSNGYNVAAAVPGSSSPPVAPPCPSGWSNPQSCGTYAHSHPTTCIGQHFFPGPYDPRVCASYAATQNLKNGESSAISSYNSGHCSFFNAYMLKKNGAPLGTYCSLFAEKYDASYATYQPGVQGSDKWEIETSWSFEVSASASA